MAITGSTWDQFGNLTGRIADPTAAQIATMQAAVDVLVADAATPTQAHVNTMVTAWNAVSSAVGTGGGVKIIVDSAIITTRNQLVMAIEAYLKRLSTSTTFT